MPAATRKALDELGWPMGESDGGFGRYECIEYRMSGVGIASLHRPARCVRMAWRWLTRAALSGFDERFETREGLIPLARNAIEVMLHGV